MKAETRQDNPGPYVTHLTVAKGPAMTAKAIRHVRILILALDCFVAVAELYAGPAGALLKRVEAYERNLQAS